MSRPRFRHRHDEAISIRLGALEFSKKGVSRYDVRDLYHLAVTLRSSVRRSRRVTLVVTPTAGKALSRKLTLTR